MFEELINIIEAHYFNSGVAFHSMDAKQKNAVLSLIEDGLRYESIKYKWLSNEEITKEDFGE